jgi:hypothetical protein
MFVDLLEASRRLCGVIQCNILTIVNMGLRYIHIFKNGHAHISIELQHMILFYMDYSVFLPL